MSLSFRADTRANALPVQTTATVPTNSSSPDEAEAGSSTPPSAPTAKVSYDNVNNFIATPPGYQGEVRPGHLIFNANYESGNLGRVEYINEYEYDLFIRPDTGNEKHRVWFYFTVENARPGQHVIFHIVNCSKTKSLYRNGMTPVVRSKTRPHWVRLPEKQLFWYRSPQHHNNYVASIVFCFDRTDDQYAFAYCYPYSYARLQKYLEAVERRRLPTFHRQLLHLSLQQRRLDLVTITNPRNLNNTLRDGQKRHVVFLSSRVHPGETPASFVCQGLMDFLLSDHPVAKTLTDNIVFMIVPMLNPDGVVLGNYRSSLLGYDLNRHWQEPAPWCHPTIYAIKNFILNLTRDQNVEFDFYIDIHAHSSQLNGFMYGNHYEDTTRTERQKLFPTLFSEFAPDFSRTDTVFDADRAKIGTGRRTLGGILADSTFSYTLEVSFFSFEVRSNEKDASAANAASADGAAQLPNGVSPAPGTGSSAVPASTSVSNGSGLANPTTRRLNYTEEGYAKLGRNLARTFLAYYQRTGTVNAAVASAALAPPSLSTSSVSSMSGSGAARANGPNKGAQSAQQQLDALALRSARGETSTSARSALQQATGIMSQLSSARSDANANRPLQPQATSSMTPRQMNSGRANGFVASTSTSGSLLDSLLPPPGSTAAQGPLSRVRPLPNIPLSEQQLHASQQQQQQQFQQATLQQPPQTATPDARQQGEEGQPQRPEEEEQVAPSGVEPVDNRVPETDADADDVPNGEEERADAGGECLPEEENDSSSDASEFAE